MISQLPNWKFLLVWSIPFLWVVSQLIGKRKLTAVCSHQTRIGNLDAHLTQTDI